MISLETLRGVWRLDRVIEDRRTRLIGRFTGTSIWQDDGAGLTQTETGRLTYGTAPAMIATRRFLWRDDDGGLEVFFDDGRPFHKLRTDHPEALHSCPPDTYRVCYDFRDWPDWRATWHVTGPRKDMTLSSRFRREGEGRE